MKLRKLALTLAGALAAAALLLAQADTTLQRAIRKETMEGDLKGAIELYQKAISQSGKDRTTAAQALLRLGDCYEKQGDKQARQAYERLVKEFGDSKEASQARTKLAALGGGAGNGGMTTTSVWRSDVLPMRGVLVASDKPLVAYLNGDTGDLMLRDLLTGELRNLTNNGPGQKGKEGASFPVISADGKIVVYNWARDFEDKLEMRSINTDGTGMRIHLSGNRRQVHQPIALSPDKKTVIVETPAIESGGMPILQALSLADNSLKPFAEGFRGGWAGHASFSPDGKLVALAGSIGPLADSGNDLFLANADGAGLRPLLTEQANHAYPRWTADSKWIVFVSNRTGQRGVWAIPSAGGEPRLLKKEPDVIALNGLMRDGSLFYTTATDQRDVQIARLDPATLTVTGEPGRFIDTFLGRNDYSQFSPDGKWIAWESIGPERDGYLVRPTVGGQQKIVFTAPVGMWPLRWFPDSQALLIRQNGSGQSILDRVEIADGRATEVYHGALGNDVPAVIAGPDGNVLLWVRCEAPGYLTPPAQAGSNCGLVRYNLQTKSETVETLSGIVDGMKVVSSPDGKWLAMRARLPSADVYSLFVRPMAAGGKLSELVRGITGVAQGFTFTPDSKQILYAVWDTSPPFHEFRVVPVEGGTPKSIPLAGQSPSFHPDGRLAYTQSSSRFETWMVRNLPLK